MCNCFLLGGFLWFCSLKNMFLLSMFIYLYLWFIVIHTLLLDLLMYVVFQAWKILYTQTCSDSSLIFICLAISYLSATNHFNGYEGSQGPNTHSQEVLSQQEKRSLNTIKVTLVVTIHMVMNNDNGLSESLRYSAMSEKKNAYKPTEIIPHGISA